MILLFIWVSFEMSLLNSSKKKKKIKEGGTFPNLFYKDSITLNNKAR